jgi:hypothetical protein
MRICKRRWHEGMLEQAAGSTQPAAGSTHYAAARRQHAGASTLTHTPTLYNNLDVRSKAIMLRRMLRRMLPLERVRFIFEACRMGGWRDGGMEGWRDGGTCAKHASRLQMVSSHSLEPILS